MTTLQEALPCPFCGKHHTLQVISGQELMDENQEFWQHSDSFGVVCDASTPDGKGGCGAMGGFKPTEDEAIEAWNTRTALAQQGEQPVAWVLTAELEKRETTTRAHLWFTNPVNCMWTPIYTGTTSPKEQP